MTDYVVIEIASRGIARGTLAANYGQNGPAELLIDVGGVTSDPPLPMATRRSLLTGSAGAAGGHEPWEKIGCLECGQTPCIKQCDVLLNPLWLKTLQINVLTMQKSMSPSTRFT